MARRRRLPGRDDLTIAASFVRGALDAGRRPAHQDRPPTDRPDVTGSPPPEEPVATAPAVEFGGGQPDEETTEETVCVEEDPTQEEDALPEPDEPTEGPDLGADDAAPSMNAADSGDAEDADDGAQERPPSAASPTSPDGDVTDEPGAAVALRAAVEPEAAGTAPTKGGLAPDESLADGSSAPMDEPPVADESPVPSSETTATPSRLRLRRPLLAAGGACLIVGAAAIVIATAAGGGNSATTPPAASATSSTGLSAPVTLPAIAKGTEPTATPGATGTTVKGQPARETTSTKNTTETAGSSTTLGNAATLERVRSLARGAGFTVFALRDPSWQLEQLTLGQTASHGYVAMVYRKGSQYMSVSQEPRAQSTEVPNAQKVVIDGQPGEMVDMGSVVLISWRDKGTLITLSTDVPRADALQLAAKFKAVN